MLRKTLLALGLAALATVPLRAQAPAATDVAKTINDLEVQWVASLAAGNWDAVQSFLTPDFIGTGEDGKRLDRAAYIASLRDSGVKFSHYTNGPYSVLVNGGTAVHLGEATYTSTANNGKATKIHLVWTDTWVLMPNGQWLCIAAQYVGHELK